MLQLTRMYACLTVSLVGLMAMGLSISLLPALVTHATCAGLHTQHETEATQDTKDTQGRHYAKTCRC